MFSLSSPTDSATPVDEKPEEMVVEHRHSNSPDSEEVGIHVKLGIFIFFI